MKILMLGWELPPYHTGGLGVACYQLCKALALKGVEIDFVVPYHDQHADVDFMNVIPALPYTAQALRAAGGAYDSRTFGQDQQRATVPTGLRDQQLQYTQSVKRLVQTKQYDAIHAHDWLTFEAGMAAKQRTQSPLIAHVHATEFDRSGEHHGNPLVHDIEYNALLMADRIIAVSNATKDLIAREYAIPADKIDVMHNSIDIADIAPADPENAYVYLEKMKQQGYKVVVNLGRLTIQKGLTHLLRAAQLVIEKNPKVLFLLAGTGEQYHELLELSADLGIAENVVFTGGFVRGKQWRDAFAIGDMFVMPSVSEPFGITPLEAIGYGNVVLLSKQSGVGEIMHNVLKFDYWDIRKLADQILAVAEHDSLRQELFTNSLQEFRELSWHKVADTCQTIYSRTLSAQQGVLV